MQGPAEEEEQAEEEEEEEEEDSWPRDRAGNAAQDREMRHELGTLAVSRTGLAAVGAREGTAHVLNCSWCNSQSKTDSPLCISGNEDSDFLPLPLFLVLVRCSLAETDPTLLAGTVAWRDRVESPFGS